MKFKRIAGLAAAALLALSCVSCSTENIDCPADESGVHQSGESSGKESNQIPNPMTEVASADEINSRIGCFIKSLDGSEEEKYTVFSGETELGEYRFSVDGAEYVLRAAKTAGDISGVYTAEGLLGDIVEPDAVKDCGEGVFYEKWFDGDMQYSLYGSNTVAADFDTVAFFFKN